MQLRVLTTADLVWTMTDTSRDSLPHYQCGAGAYKRSYTVDPFPAYPHDPARVADLIAACDAALPLSAGRSELCLLEHEFVGRTNGLCAEDTIYKRDDGTDWDEEVLCYCGCGKKLKLQGQANTIVICGKRIPPMPAMTRYLVTHEYGHAAFNQTRRLLGYSASEDDKLEAEYMRIRGGGEATPRREKPSERWHRLVSEVVANDFRCVVMRTELEFWPHDVPQMGPDSPIAAWWADAIARAKAGTS